jgi:hypothetical protein
MTLAEKLLDCVDRDKAKALLEPLSVSQLKDLASHFDVNCNGASKPIIVSRLVESVVGSRLNSATIQRLS